MKKVVAKISSKKEKLNWQPMALEVSAIVLKGILTGLSVQSGIFLFDKTFKGKSGNLLMFKGEKRTGA
jgi:hypothetical protein